MSVWLSEIEVTVLEHDDSTGHVWRDPRLFGKTWTLGRQSVVSRVFLKLLSVIGQHSYRMPRDSEGQKSLWRACH